ncbi:MAG: type II toxin-antitoxin system VapC family toxin [Acidobacteriota bacterium]
MDRPYLDTSALAKWYLNEPFSDAVENFLLSLPYAWISSLTLLELRCLLARRRRSREITAEMEGQIMAIADHDVTQEHLRLVLLQERDVETAAVIVSSLPGQPLRTLDALHLSMVQSKGIKALATADRVMAAAGEALGLTVTKFFRNRSNRGK